MTASQVFFNSYEDMIKAFHASDTPQEVREVAFNAINSQNPAIIQSFIRPMEQQQVEQPVAEVAEDNKADTPSESTQAEQPVEVQEAEQTTEQSVQDVPEHVLNERALYNETTQEYTKMLAESEAAVKEAEQRAAEAERRINELLKQQEQKESDESGENTSSQDSFYTVPEAEAQNAEVPVQQGYDPEAERRAERVKYEEFFRSEYGKSLDPGVSVAVAIEEFVDFYNKIKEDDSDFASNAARVLMKDIETYGVEAPSVKARLGDVDVPNSFLNMFKAYQIQLLDTDREIDPRTGVVKNVNRNTMIDTYKAANIDTLIAQAKADGAKEAMEKLSQHQVQQQSAVQPQQYTTHSSPDVNNILNDTKTRANKIQELAAKYKFKNISDPSLLTRITDPDDARFIAGIQNEYKSLM